MRWVKHFGGIAVVVLLTMFAVKKIPFLNNLVG